MGSIKKLGPFLNLIPITPFFSCFSLNQASFSTLAWTTFLPDFMVGGPTEVRTRWFQWDRGPAVLSIESVVSPGEKARWKSLQCIFSTLNSSGFYIPYALSALGCQRQLWTNLPFSRKINQQVIADANRQAACPCSADYFGALSGQGQDFLMVPTVCRMVRCYLGLQMLGFVVLSL